MYSLDNESGVTVMPLIKTQRKKPNEPQWFTEGGNGVAPSYPGADWFNIVQAELLNVLTDGGITPDKTQLNQISTAIRAIVANALATGLNGKAALSHQHTSQQITDFNQAVANNFEYKKIGDFEIRKFPDGTMIQTTEYYTASHGNSINGIILNYPESFIETPKVFLTLKSYTSNIRDGFVTINKSQNNESLINFWILESTYNSPLAYVDLIAVGRWK